MSKALAFLSLHHVALMIFLITLSLAACGSADPENTSLACVATEGEVHLAEGHSHPSEMETMLHQVEQTCPSTGWNTFRLHARDAASAAHAASLQSLASMHAQDVMEDPVLSITAVDATMISMGHGTVESPRWSEGSDFQVKFQMPGSWRIDVDFQVAGKVTSETASFTIDVR